MYNDNITRLFGINFLVMGLVSLVTPDLFGSNVVVGFSLGTVLFMLADVVIYCRDQWFESGWDAGKYKNKEVTWKTFIG